MLCWRRSLPYLLSPILRTHHLTFQAKMPALLRRVHTCLNLRGMTRSAHIGRVLSVAFLLETLLWGTDVAWADKSAEPLAVDIKEYALPTPNALPHDPALGPDSSLWFTEQKANKIGRLEPTTGRIREFPLRTRDSGPHGLVVDKQGNVWFTANSKGYIGKLNAESGEVAEYPLKDERAKDPHTPTFDAKGTLWFTVQEGNLIGRLDPKSGEVRLKEVPTPKARPYGIVVGKDGAPYFCEFGINKLGRVDPVTLEIREYALPSGARPRRIALASDGTLFYSDYARGMLGHFFPQDGRVEEWTSPGGPTSKPYGIAIAPDGQVWYSESGVSPNTLVRFNPLTQRFAEATIPSGGGVVRNMASTPQGRLYLACSGVNRVAIATPRQERG